MKLILQNKLDKAFQAFFRRVKFGETPGFPRFKPATQYTSFTYRRSGYSINGSDRRHGEQLPVTDD